MSDPSTTTLHSSLTEGAQDPQTGIILTDPLADHHAKCEAHFAAHLARLDALASAVVLTCDEVIAAGTGQMGISSKTGKPQQYPSAVAEWGGTLRQLHAQVAIGGFGQKFDAWGIYAAVPRVPQDAHAKNYHHSRLLTIDHDGLRSAEAVELVKQACERWACILWSTHNHNPPYIYRLRLVLQMSHACRTVEEHKRVAARVCAMLGVLIGSADGIDPCTKQAFQVALTPVWKDAAAKALALLPILYEGSSLPTGEMLKEIRAEIAAEAAEIAAEATLREGARKLIRPEGGAVQFHDDGSVDKLEGCRRELQAFPIVAGQGQRNKRLPIAVGKCIEWDLDQAQAERLMLEVYGADVDEGGWVSRWIETIYSKPDPEGRRGRRLGRAQTQALLSLGGVFDLDASPSEDNTGEYRADILPIKKSDGNISACAHNAVEGDPVRRGPTQLDTRFLPEVDLAELATRGKIHPMKSACGTGKNWRLAKAFAQAAQSGQMLVATSCRQSLCASMADDLGIANYLDIQAREITVPVAVCLDSLQRVPRLSFTGEGVEETHLRALLLDEVQQTFRHLFGETIASKNLCGVIFNDLKQKIANADLVLAQDADLDYLTLFALHVLSGSSLEEIRANLVINTWTNKDLRAYRYKKEGGWWRSLLAWAEVAPIACFCTTKTAVRKFARDFRRRYPDKKTLVIDGDRGGDEAVRAALKDKSLLAGYDAIFYNSAWGTGVDIRIPDTFRVFGHLKAGKLIAQDCRQGLSRVRHPVDNAWHILMSGSSPKRETDPDKIMEALLLPCQESMRRLDDIGAGWSPVYRGGSRVVAALAPDNIDLVRIWALKEAYEAEWGATYHTVTHDDGTVVEGTIERHFREIGIPLLDAPDALEPEEEAAAEEALEAAKVAEDADEIARLQAAPLASDKEVEALESQPRTLETTAIVKAHAIRRFYGWDELDEEKIKWDRKGRGRKMCRTFQHCLLWEAGTCEPILAKDAVAADTGYMVHFRNLGVEADTMITMWKQVFGISDLRAAAEQGTVLRAKRNVLKSRPVLDMLARNLDMHFNADDQANIMNLARSLVARMGLKLKPGKQIRLPDGKRSQEYSLDPASFAAMDEKSSVYRQIMLDPKWRKPLPPPLQADLDEARRKHEELVAAILSEEYPLAA